MKYIIFLSAILTTACAHGPEQEKRSVTDYLSEKHYEGTGVVFGVPVLKRKVVDTSITGKVLLVDQLAGVPSDLKVQLLKDKRVVQDGFIRSDGSFRVEGQIARGSYLLRAFNDKFLGEKSIQVDKFEVGDVQIPVSRR